MLQSESSLDEQQPGMGPGLWQQGSKAGLYWTKSKKESKKETASQNRNIS